MYTYSYMKFCFPRRFRAKQLTSKLWATILSLLFTIAVVIADNPNDNLSVNEHHLLEPSVS